MYITAELCIIKIMEDYDPFFPTIEDSDILAPVINDIMKLKPGNKYEIAGDEGVGTGEDEEDSEENDDESDDNEEDMDDDDDDEEAGDSSGDETAERCPVCLCRFKDQDVGTPESCDHTFCLDCIQEWAKNVNTCPADRTVFNLIMARHGLNGEIFMRIPVEDKNSMKELDNEFDEPEEDTILCEVCGRGDREDRLLLCDGCDQGYHLDCLTPPLRVVPVDEWFCAACAERNQAAESPQTRATHRRQIARTLVSERVRAHLQESRLRQARPGRLLLQSDDDEEEDVEGFVTAADVLAASTGDHTIKSSRTTRSRGRKTGGKRKSARRTQRSTSRKGGKKRGRRGSKRRSKASTSSTKALVTPKTRIAKNLGLVQPKRGRSIPEVKPKMDKGNTLDLPGFTPLSIMGNKNELIAFDDGRSVKKSVTVSQSATTATSSCDLLGSIMLGQDLLHRDAKQVTISRDGTLCARKRTPSPIPRPVTPPDENKAIQSGNDSVRDISSSSDASRSQSPNKIEDWPDVRPLHMQLSALQQMAGYDSSPSMPHDSDGADNDDGAGDGGSENGETLEGQDGGSEANDCEDDEGSDGLNEGEANESGAGAGGDDQDERDEQGDENNEDEDDDMRKEEEDEEEDEVEEAEEVEEAQEEEKTDNEDEENAEVEEVEEDVHENVEEDAEVGQEEDSETNMEEIETRDVGAVEEEADEIMSESGEQKEDDADAASELDVNEEEPHEDDEERAEEAEESVNDDGVEAEEDQVIGEEETQEDELAEKAVDMEEEAAADEDCEEEVDESLDGETILEEEAEAEAVEEDVEGEAEDAEEEFAGDSDAEVGQEVAGEEQDTVEEETEELEGDAEDLGEDGEVDDGGGTPGLEEDEAGRTPNLEEDEVYAAEEGEQRTPEQSPQYLGDSRIVQERTPVKERPQAPSSETMVLYEDLGDEDQDAETLQEYAPKLPVSELPRIPKLNKNRLQIEIRNGGEESREVEDDRRRRRHRDGEEDDREDRHRRRERHSRFEEEEGKEKGRKRSSSRDRRGRRSRSRDKSRRDDDGGKRRSRSRDRGKRRRRDREDSYDRDRSPDHRRRKRDRDEPRGSSRRRDKDEFGRDLSSRDRYNRDGKEYASSSKDKDYYEVDRGRKGDDDRGHRKRSKRDDDLYDSAYQDDYRSDEKYRKSYDREEKYGRERDDKRSKDRYSKEEKFGVDSKYWEKRDDRPRDDPFQQQFNQTKPPEPLQSIPTLSTQGPDVDNQPVDMDLTYDPADPTDDVTPSPPLDALVMDEDPSRESVLVSVPMHPPPFRPNEPPPNFKPNEPPPHLPVWQGLPPGMAAQAQGPPCPPGPPGPPAPPGGGLQGELLRHQVHLVGAQNVPGLPGLPQNIRQGLVINPMLLNPLNRLPMMAGVAGMQLPPGMQHLQNRMVAPGMGLPPGARVPFEATMDPVRLLGGPSMDLGQRVPTSMTLVNIAEAPKVSSPQIPPPEILRNMPPPRLPIGMQQSLLRPPRASSPEGPPPPPPPPPKMPTQQIPTPVQQQESPKKSQQDQTMDSIAALQRIKTLGSLLNTQVAMASLATMRPVDDGSGESFKTPLPPKKVDFKVPPPPRLAKEDKPAEIVEPVEMDMSSPTMDIDDSPPALDIVDIEAKEEKIEKKEKKGKENKDESPKRKKEKKKDKEKEKEKGSPRRKEYKEKKKESSSKKKDEWAELVGAGEKKRESKLQCGARRFVPIGTRVWDMAEQLTPFDDDGCEGRTTNRAFTELLGVGPVPSDTVVILLAVLKAMMVISTTTCTSSVQPVYPNVRLAQLDGTEDDSHSQENIASEGISDKSKTKKAFNKEEAKSAAELAASKLKMLRMKQSTASNEDNPSGSTKQSNTALEKDTPKLSSAEVSRLSVPTSSSNPPGKVASVSEGGKRFQESVCDITKGQTLCASSTALKDDGHRTRRQLFTNPSIVISSVQERLSSTGSFLPPTIPSSHVRSPLQHARPNNSPRVPSSHSADSVSHNVDKDEQKLLSIGASNLSNSQEKTSSSSGRELSSGQTPCVFSTTSGPTLGVSSTTSGQTLGMSYTTSKDDINSTRNKSPAVSQSLTISSANVPPVQKRWSAAMDFQSPRVSSNIRPPLHLVSPHNQPRMPTLQSVPHRMTVISSPRIPSPTSNLARCPTGLQTPFSSSSCTPQPVPPPSVRPSAAVDKQTPQPVPPPSQSSSSGSGASIKSTVSEKNAASGSSSRSWTPAQDFCTPARVSTPAHTSTPATASIAAPETVKQTTQDSDSKIFVRNFEEFMQKMMLLQQGSAAAKVNAAPVGSISPCTTTVGGVKTVSTASSKIDVRAAGHRNATHGGASSSVSSTVVSKTPSIVTSTSSNTRQSETAVGSSMKTPSVGPTKVLSKEATTSASWSSSKPLATIGSELCSPSVSLVTHVYTEATAVSNRGLNIGSAKTHVAAGVSLNTEQSKSPSTTPTKGHGHDSGMSSAVPRQLQGSVVSSTKSVTEPKKSLAIESVVTVDARPVPKPVSATESASTLNALSVASVKGADLPPSNSGLSESPSTRVSGGHESGISRPARMPTASFIGFAKSLNDATTESHEIEQSKSFSFTASQSESVKRYLSETATSNTRPLQTKEIAISQSFQTFKTTSPVSAASKAFSPAVSRQPEITVVTSTNTPLVGHPKVLTVASASNSDTSSQNSISVTPSVLNASAVVSVKVADVTSLNKEQVEAPLPASTRNSVPHHCASTASFIGFAEPQETELMKSSSFSASQSGVNTVTTPLSNTPTLQTTETSNKHSHINTARYTVASVSTASSTFSPAASKQSKATVSDTGPTLKPTTATPAASALNAPSVVPVKSAGVTSSNSEQSRDTSRTATVELPSRFSRPARMSTASFIGFAKSLNNASTESQETDVTKPSAPFTPSPSEVVKPQVVAIQTPSRSLQTSETPLTKPYHSGVAISLSSAFSNSSAVTSDTGSITEPIFATASALPACSEFRESGLSVSSQSGVMNRQFTQTTMPKPAQASLVKSTAASVSANPSMLPQAALKTSTSSAAAQGSSDTPSVVALKSGGIEQMIERLTRQETAENTAPSLVGADCVAKVSTLSSVPSSDSVNNVSGGTLSAQPDKSIFEISALQTPVTRSGSPRIERIVGVARSKTAVADYNDEEKLDVLSKSLVPENVQVSDSLEATKATSKEASATAGESAERKSSHPLKSFEEMGEKQKTKSREVKRFDDESLVSLGNDQNSEKASVTVADKIAETTEPGAKSDPSEVESKRGNERSAYSNAPRIKVTSSRPLFTFCSKDGSSLKTIKLPVGKTDEPVNTEKKKHTEDVPIKDKGNVIRNQTKTENQLVHDSGREMGEHSWKDPGIGIVDQSVKKTDDASWKDDIVGVGDPSGKDAETERDCREEKSVKNDTEDEDSNRVAFLHGASGRKGILKKPTQSFDKVSLVPLSDHLYDSAILTDDTSTSWSNTQPITTNSTVVTVTAPAIISNERSLLVTYPPISSGQRNDSDKTNFSRRSTLEVFGIQSVSKPEKMEKAEFKRRLAQTSVSKPTEASPPIYDLSSLPLSFGKGAARSSDIAGGSAGLPSSFGVTPPKEPSAPVYHSGTAITLFGSTDQDYRVRPKPVPPPLPLSGAVPITSSSESTVRPPITSTSDTIVSFANKRSSVVSSTPLGTGVTASKSTSLSYPWNQEWDDPDDDDDEDQPEQSVSRKFTSQPDPVPMNTFSKSLVNKRLNEMSTTNRLSKTFSKSGDGDVRSEPVHLKPSQTKPPRLPVSLPVPVVMGETNMDSEKPRFPGPPPPVPGAPRFPMLPPLSGPLVLGAPPPFPKPEELALFPGMLEHSEYSSNDSESVVKFPGPPPPFPGPPPPFSRDPAPFPGPPPPFPGDPPPPPFQGDMPPFPGPPPPFPGPPPPFPGEHPPFPGPPPPFPGQPPPFPGQPPPFPGQPPPFPGQPPPFTGVPPVYPGDMLYDPWAVAADPSYMNASQYSQSGPDRPLFPILPTTHKEPIVEKYYTSLPPSSKLDEEKPAKELMPESRKKIKKHKKDKESSLNIPLPPSGEEEQPPLPPPLPEEEAPKPVPPPVEAPPLPPEPEKDRTAPASDDLYNPDLSESANKDIRPLEPTLKDNKNPFNWKGGNIPFLDETDEEREERLKDEAKKKAELREKLEREVMEKEQQFLDDAKKQVAQTMKEIAALEKAREDEKQVVELEDPSPKPKTQPISFKPIKIKLGKRLPFETNVLTASIEEVPKHAQTKAKNLIQLALQRQLDKHSTEAKKDDQPEQVVEGPQLPPGGLPLGVEGPQLPPGGLPATEEAAPVTLEEVVGQPIEVRVTETQDIDTNALIEDIEGGLENIFAMFNEESVEDGVRGSDRSGVRARLRSLSPKSSSKSTKKRSGRRSSSPRRRSSSPRKRSTSPKRPAKSGRSSDKRRSPDRRRSRRSRTPDKRNRERRSRKSRTPEKSSRKSRSPEKRGKKSPDKSSRKGTEKSRRSKSRDRGKKRSVSKERSRRQRSETPVAEMKKKTKGGTRSVSPITRSPSQVESVLPISVAVSELGESLPCPDSKPSKEKSSRSVSPIGNRQTDESSFSPANKVDNEIHPDEEKKNLGNNQDTASASNDIEIVVAKPCGKSETSDDQKEEKPQLLVDAENYTILKPDETKPASITVVDDLKQTESLDLVNTENSSDTANVNAPRPASPPIIEVIVDPNEFLEEMRDITECIVREKNTEEDDAVNNEVSTNKSDEDRNKMSVIGKLTEHSEGYELISDEELSDVKIDEIRDDEDTKMSFRHENSNQIDGVNDNTSATNQQQLRRLMKLKRREADYSEVDHGDLASERQEDIDFHNLSLQELKELHEKRQREKAERKKQRGEKGNNESDKEEGELEEPAKRRKFKDVQEHVKSRDQERNVPKETEVSVRLIRLERHKEDERHGERKKDSSSDRRKSDDRRHRDDKETVRHGRDSSEGERHRVGRSEEKSGRSHRKSRESSEEESSKSRRKEEKGRSEENSIKTRKEKDEKWDRRKSSDDKRNRQRSSSGSLSGSDIEVRREHDKRSRDEERHREQRRKAREEEKQRHRDEEMKKRKEQEELEKREEERRRRQEEIEERIRLEEKYREARQRERREREEYEERKREEERRRRLEEVEERIRLEEKYRETRRRERELERQRRVEEEARQEERRRTEEESRREEERLRRVEEERKRAEEERRRLEAEAWRETERRRKAEEEVRMAYERSRRRAEERREKERLEAMEAEALEKERQRLLQEAREIVSDLDISSITSEDDDRERRRRKKEKKRKKKKKRKKHKKQKKENPDGSDVEIIDDSQETTPGVHSPEKQLHRLDIEEPTLLSPILHRPGAAVAHVSPLAAARFGPKVDAVPTPESSSEPALEQRMPPPPTRDSRIPILRDSKRWVVMKPVNSEDGRESPRRIVMRDDRRQLHEVDIFYDGPETEATTNSSTGNRTELEQPTASGTLASNQSGRRLKLNRRQLAEQPSHSREFCDKLQKEIVGLILNPPTTASPSLHSSPAERPSRKRKHVEPRQEETQNQTVERTASTEQEEDNTSSLIFWREPPEKRKTPQRAPESAGRVPQSPNTEIPTDQATECVAQTAIAVEVQSLPTQSSDFEVEEGVYISREERTAMAQPTQSEAVHSSDSSGGSPKGQLVAESDYGTDVFELESDAGSEGFEPVVAESPRRMSKKVSSPKPTEKPRTPELVSPSKNTTPPELTPVKTNISQDITPPKPFQLKDPRQKSLGLSRSEEPAVDPNPRRALEFIQSYVARKTSMPSPIPPAVVINPPSRATPSTAEALEDRIANKYAALRKPKKHAETPEEEVTYIPTRKDLLAKIGSPLPADANTDVIDMDLDEGTSSEIVNPSFRPLQTTKTEAVKPFRHIPLPPLPPLPQRTAYPPSFFQETPVFSSPRLRELPLPITPERRFPPSPIESPPPSTKKTALTEQDKEDILRPFSPSAPQWSPLTANSSSSSDSDSTSDSDESIPSPPSDFDFSGRKSRKRRHRSDDSSDEEGTEQNRIMKILLKDARLSKTGARRLAKSIIHKRKREHEQSLPGRRPYTQSKVARVINWLENVSEATGSSGGPALSDNFIKKMNRQERVIEEVKLAIKPHYAAKKISKEEYKDILRKSVPKICHSKSGDINPAKIRSFIDVYVGKIRQRKKRSGEVTSTSPSSMDTAIAKYAIPERIKEKMKAKEVEKAAKKGEAVGGKKHKEKKKKH